MSSSETAKNRFAKHWSGEEKRYLISHKTDGAYLIAEALGRSVISVQTMACRLHVSLRPDVGEICPICGEFRINKGTPAGRSGMCHVCWEKEKSRALLERKRFQEERRRYEQAKWVGRKHKGSANG